MNRRLIVMRHAKSSWKDSSLSDHERPLNGRGRSEAVEVARRLEELDWVPQVVISSDSQRTTETWERMTTHLDGDIAVHWSHDLYHAGMDEVYEALIDLPDDVVDVMVLGHNPGWESVVGWLSGEYTTLTTANAALLEGEGDSWEDALERGAWELDQIIRPREL